MIESLYAWVTKINDEENNILAMGDMPLVTSQLRIANLSKPIAERIAKQSGKTCVLVRFDKAIVIYEVEP